MLGYEIHHKRKKDSPSGTALTLAQIITAKSDRKKKRGHGAGSTGLPRPTSCTSPRCAAARCPGTHTVLLDSAFDTIELTHSARSRGGFALGAVRAAEWLAGQEGVFRGERFHPGNTAGGTGMKLEGVYTALVTPFDADGKRRREGAAAAGRFPGRGRRAGPRARRHHGGEPDPGRRGMQAGHPGRRGAGARPGPRDRGGGLQLHERGHRVRAGREGSRGGRHPPGRALLQQAHHPGVPPALQGHRRRGGPAADRLQHRRPHGEEHRQPHHARAGPAQEHRRREGSKRRHQPDDGPHREEARAASPCSRATTTSCSPSWPSAARG